MARPAVSARAIKATTTRSIRFMASPPAPPGAFFDCQSLSNSSAHVNTNVSGPWPGCTDGGHRSGPTPALFEELVGPAKDPEKDAAVRAPRIVDRAGAPPDEVTRGAGAVLIHQAPLQDERLLDVRMRMLRQP